MKINRSLIPGIFFLLVSVLGYAQNSTPTAQSLTLEGAVELGTNSSEMLHIAEYRIKGYEARIREVNAARYPTLRYSGSYTRLSKVPAFQFQMPGMDRPITINPVILNQFSNRLALQQPIFMGGRLKNNVLLADLNQKIGESEYNRDKADVILNIKTAYWNLYRAQQLKKQVDEAIEQVKAHLVDTENYMKQGLATTNDVLKLKVQLSNTKLQQIDVNNMIRLASSSLNTFLNLPAGTETQLTSSPGKGTVISASLDELIAKALENRNEIKATELRIKSGELGVKMAKAGYLPQVAVFGDYYYNNPNQRIMPQRDRFDATWDAGISVTFDIWTWNTPKHQADQAKYGVLQAQETMSMIKEQITLDVTQQYLNMLQATEKISVAEQTITQAEENLRITEQKLKKGMVLTTDLVDAQTSVLNARLSLVAASVDYEMAIARLEKAVGGLN